ncbi:MAG: glucose dehydrogenase [Candidatus Eisenbacteria bacterium]|nr:glucose dehydrogenase [Candidatus Eisenbacteria bacterium]
MWRNTILVSAALLLASAAAFGQITSELVVDGLNRPVQVAAPDGDERLFILEQRGVVLLLEDGSLLPQPFLDITADVMDPSAYSEQGLLGIAFHPDFATNRLFYVHYTDNAGDTVIERYEAQSGNPDQADLSTAATVLTQTQPYGNHNGGTIDFGPDGYLYFGFGDGGGAGDPDGNAQDPTTLLGKFIRIDVDSLPYSIPPSNPFVGDAGVLDEIWATGLRNPYRWSFDSATGDLWIADVGQNAWEEIAVQAASSTGGENYGWDVTEGTHCYEPPSGCGADTFDLPVYEYGHQNGRCSITGGWVYRGVGVPELEGYYIFGDFCSNEIWAILFDGSSVTDTLDLTDELNPDGRIDALASIAAGGDGELYLVDRAGTTDGEVYRVTLDSSDIEPGDTEPRMGMGRPFPNPFGTSTEFSISMTEGGVLDVTVLNAAGAVVKELVSRAGSPGARTVRWDGTDAGGNAVSSGTYFIMAQALGETRTRRVSVVR